MRGTGGYGAGCWLCLSALLASAQAATDAAADDVTSSPPAQAWYQLPAPDQSDWSNSRKTGYARSLQVDLGEPSAVVTIPMLNLAVHVYPDTDKVSLERGVAWVAGTSAPGGSGNIAIAGHRDSYFRPLENITLDARIQVATREGDIEYRVSSISIVDALDTQPLLQTGESVITLITCHPFRYRGYAPDRYIVRAHRVEDTSMASRSGQFGSAQTSGHIIQNERE